MSDQLPSPAALKGPKARLHPTTSRLPLPLQVESGSRNVAVGERLRVILEDDFNTGLQRAVCLECTWDGNWGDGIEAGEDQADHEIYGCQRRYLRHLTAPAARPPDRW